VKTTSKRRQPQRLPPPITHGAEALDGEVILNEHPDELGLLLWKTVRSIRLWAELGEGERGRAFDQEAHHRRLERLNAASVPAEIAGPLTRAADVLHPRARSATIAAACRSVAQWSSSQGAVGTAIEFLQAAALALPTDAALAHDLARLARTHAEYLRAETWYRQAIARARRAGQWYDFARAYIGLGNTFRLRGSFPQARKCLIRGLRAAKRFSHQPLVAAGYHDLMVLALNSGRPAEVTRYAHAALHAYGQGHSNLPALAFDYGAFILESGYFAEALRIFRSVPDTFGQPIHQLTRYSAIVRAAGALRDRSVYAEAWSAAEALIDRADVVSAATYALMDMARGAEGMGDVEAAERTALRSVEAASEHGETALEQEALAVLASARSAGALARSGTSGKEVPVDVLRLVEDFEVGLGATQSA
jgi:tetratricopeptide (TPR) repeat protein